MFSAAKTSGPSGYKLSNSLRFRASASAYLNRTPSSTTNRNTWTISVWVKRSNIGGWGVLLNSGTTSNFEYFTFRSDDTLQWVTYSTAIQANLITTQVFRDPSAWYHLVLAFDSTQATSSNRLKLYVNGSQVTAFGTASYPSLNYNSYINLNQVHNIGKDGFGDYLDGYMAEYNFIDGQALTPSSFGITDATTGVWQPKQYTGTYGTNGFYLNFSNIALTSGSNTGLGQDYSGNGNYWNTNNISVTAGTTYDAMTDVPTLTSATVANYAVINPLTLRSGTGTVSVTTSNANMTWNFQTSGASPVNYMVSGTVGMSSGKWYWEVTPTTITATTGLLIGVGANPYSSTNFWSTNGNSTEYMYISNNGNKANNNVSSAYGATYTTNDVIGVALDMDAGTLTFYKNNVSQGTAYTGLSGTYFPFLACPSSAATDVVQVNFGQRPFTYTPPTGFVALNTYNLPTSTIVQGNKYMDATLYTGNGGTQTITNAAGFKPDLVWVKARSAAAGHVLEDTVRGFGSTTTLASEATGAEGAYSQFGYMSASNSNGFTVNTGSSTAENTNFNARTYVGWQWQAGQGTTSSNTSGSITSTVSVNATAGFSIVTYTGNGSANQTIGHGLGVAPKMAIIKGRSNAFGWGVQHIGLTGGNNYLALNTTAAQATDNTQGSISNANSTTLQISGSGGASSWANANAATYVAYCWAAISGFSAFGSYTGNGSADGVFVYTGFRPKYIMIKCSSAAANDWPIIDTSRATYNVAGPELYADLSQAETTSNYIDIVSNGFKIRSTGGQVNTNGVTYIYAAFAENPFKNALAR